MPLLPCPAFRLSLTPAEVSRSEKSVDNRAGLNLLQRLCLR